MTIARIHGISKESKREGGGIGIAMIGEIDMTGQANRGPVRDSKYGYEYRRIGRSRARKRQRPKGPEIFDR